MSIWNQILSQSVCLVWVWEKVVQRGGSGCSSAQYLYPQSWSSSWDQFLPQSSDHQSLYRTESWKKKLASASRHTSTHRTLVELSHG